MKQALILVDIQNDYFPGGNMVLEGTHEAAANAASLLASFRVSKLPVFHIQHIATRPGANFFLPGTSGVEIHESVMPLVGETVIQKHFPNSFRETTLLACLREQGVTNLVIAGMMTHMCIDTTTRAACDLGFVCRLAHDACATKALSFGQTTVTANQVQVAYLSALDGTFAEVIDTQTLIDSVTAHCEPHY